LLKCCPQKSQWPRAEWREPPRKTQPCKTVAEKYSPGDVSVISLHWRKDICSGHTKPTEWLHTCSNQEERRGDHCVATERLRTRLTSSHWWLQSANHKWLTVHQFDSLVVHEVKINEACYHSVLLLQQFLLAVRQISSKFFIFQQENDPFHTTLRQSAFLSVISPDVGRF